VCHPPTFSNGTQKEVAPPGVAQKRQAAVTTEGDKMEVTGAVVSL
jgi:hypothetical protein